MKPRTADISRIYNAKDRFCTMPFILDARLQLALEPSIGPILAWNKSQTITLGTPGIESVQASWDGAKPGEEVSEENL